MKEEKRKYKLGETGFWPSWLAKLLFTLISVKLWGLIASISISTWLLFLHYEHQPVIFGNTIIDFGINGTQWVSFNTAIWALIFGMKEIFRISEQSEYSERLMLRESLENKIRIAGMISCKKTENNDANTSIEGFKRVGPEPEEFFLPHPNPSP
jgi:hypothetical protein